MVIKAGRMKFQARYDGTCPLSGEEEAGRFLIYIASCQPGMVI